MTKITVDKALIEQGVKFCETWPAYGGTELAGALRAALAEPAVEPIGYLAFRDGKPAWDEDCVCEDAVYPVDSDDDRVSVAIYTAPQAQQPASHAEELPEYIRKTNGTMEDRRRPELQPDGAYIMRDTKTKQAYSVSTGAKIHVPERIFRSSDSVYGGCGREPPTQTGVGNSGFDHKIAADFMSGREINDENVRKFVMASRWAHDDRVSLQALVATLRQDVAARDAEIALLKQSLLDAESLAEPAREPVAWRAKDANGRWMYGDLPAPELPADAPQLLFASPPPPAEVPLLTERELIDLFGGYGGLHTTQLMQFRIVEQAVRQNAGLP